MRHSRSWLLAVALVLSGCGLHGKPKIARVKAATEGAAAPSEQSAFLEPARVVAPGIVEAWGGNVELSPQESGWVASVLVAEGAHVVAGDLLATLDDERERAAFELARAELSETEATRAKTVRGATREELDRARAEAAASRARADLAERDHVRSASLGEQRAVASAEVERAAATADAEGAVARASAASLAALERGSRSEDRTAAGDRVAAARARLSLAQTNLERRHVRAPITGVVLSSNLHRGEFFIVGKAPFLVLGDTSKLQVRLEVDEVDAFRVHTGAKCALFADDAASLGQGTVHRAAPRMGRRALTIESPTARADVRVREVYIELAASPSLLPGQRVWGHIDPSETSNGAQTAN